MDLLVFGKEERNVKLYLLSISGPCLFVSSPQSLFLLRCRNLGLATGLGRGERSKPEEGRFRAEERHHVVEPH